MSSSKWLLSHLTIDEAAGLRKSGSVAALYGQSPLSETHFGLSAAVPQGAARRIHKVPGPQKQISITFTVAVGHMIGGPRSGSGYDAIDASFN